MLPRFYPVVNHVDWLEWFLPLGVALIQLRIKDCPYEDVQKQIREAVRIGKTYNATVVINDYWQAAIEEEAAYIHLGQEDIAAADVKAIKRAGIPFGVSTHDHAELDYALSFDPDYVALGPIFSPIAKSMAIGPQGLSRVTEWKRLIGDRPLVAIGGIRLGTVQDVLQAGADCVACIGDVVQNDNPKEQARQWIKEIGRVLEITGSITVGKSVV